MAKKARKAFTIVELVIVIAVVAILMAVLIPTFVSLVKKANVSADSQLVRNLNTILTAEGVTEGKNPTMHDALADAFENGYDITKISPTSEGNDIVWDSKTDRFALVDATGRAVFAEEGTTLSTGVALWKIYDKMPDTQTYSIYAGKKWTAMEVGTAGTPLTVGFDAGDISTITSVLYQRGADAASQEVVIRTNSASTDLTINAPVDTVQHYGEAKSVDIQQIKDQSYHEVGKSYFAKIESGRIVAESTGYIDTLYVAKENQANVKISIKGSGQVVHYVTDATEGEFNAAQVVDGSVTQYVFGATAEQIQEMQTEAEGKANIAAGSIVVFESTGGVKTYFKTITAALNENSYGTITLYGDITEAFALNSGNLTLDLNGYTITGTEGKDIVIENRGNLTITDSSEGKAGKIYLSDRGYRKGAVVHAYNGSTTTIENGTLDTDGDYALYMESSSDQPSTLNINGGTIIGSYYGVYVAARNNSSANGAVITMTGGTVATKATNYNSDPSNTYGNAFAVYGCASCTISGGTIKSETPASSSYYGAAFVLFGQTSSINATITGGTFIGAATPTDANENSGSAIQAGGQGGGGATITIQPDVANGKTVTVGGSGIGLYATNNSTINVYDGVSVETTNTACQTNIAMNATINVYGGTFTTKSTCFFAWLDGTINIHNGVINAEKNAVWIEDDDSGVKTTANIYGGTINGQWNAVYAWGPAAEVNISGGELTGTNMGLYCENEVTVNISGGTITGNGRHGVYASSSSVEVTNGTIKGEDRAIFATNGSTATVSGGYFKGQYTTSYSTLPQWTITLQDVNGAVSAPIADDCHAEYSDGMFHVVADSN